MIIDLSAMRNQLHSLVNKSLFEMQMKGVKINGKVIIALLSATGLIFPGSRAFASDIHSYEIMDQVRSSGDFINSVIFGLVPVYQQLQINDIKMVKTYLENHKIA